MRRWKMVVGLPALAVVSFALTTVVVQANNQWSCWHWDHNTITFSNAASGYWGTIISSEANQWDAATCVDLVGGGNEIIGDAGFYGNTGWLGIARILQSGAGCTIVQADMLMNQSYLDGASYDEIDDRHVTCQEFGHTIGLDHRKRNAQTCMNDRVLGYPDFDSHDAGVVDSITEGCGGSGGDPCANGGERGRRKCSDGIDNDGDGCVDGDDPDCN